MIPPTNAIRAQWYFQDQRMEWSETLWHQTGVDLTAALADAILYANERVQLLGQGVRMMEVRVSQDNVFRDSNVDTRFEDWGFPAGASFPQRIYNTALLTGTPASAFAAAPTRALLLRMFGQIGSEKYLHRRPMYLSGMPDYVVSDQGGPQLSAGAWNAAYDLWRQTTQSTGGPWGFVVFHTPSDLEKARVTQIARGTPTGEVVITLAANVGIAAGDTIEVYRPQFNPGSLKIQGKYEVNTVTGNVLTVRDPRAGDVDYFRGGTVWKVTREFAKIWKIATETFVTRKRGAAEFAPRGRLRSRRNFAG